MEEIFIDIFNNKILLTNKHWMHIINEHPEIEPYNDNLSDVLSKPDFVKRSKRDKDTFLYYRYYKNIYNGKYFLVVARIKDTPLLLTCYISDRIKEGEQIWKKD